MSGPPRRWVGIELWWQALFNSPILDAGRTRAAGGSGSLWGYKRAVLLIRWGTGAFKLSVYQQSIDVMLFLSQLKQGDFEDSLKVAATSSVCLASVELCPCLPLKLLRFGWVYRTAGSGPFDRLLFLVSSGCYLQATAERMKGERDLKQQQQICGCI